LPKLPYGGPYNRIDQWTTPHRHYKTEACVITGEKEYDVYVLIERSGFWQSIFWWWPRTYEIVLGTSFATAEEAARSAQIKANAANGRAIGIAADAIVCCREQANIVG
jgi:hypothetical protein